MRKVSLPYLLFKQLPQFQIAVTNDGVLTLGCPPALCSSPLLEMLLQEKGITCSMSHFYRSWIHFIFCVSKYT